MSAIANSNQPEDKPKTSRVKSYWRTYWQNSPWKKLASLVMAIALSFYLTACGGESKQANKSAVTKVETAIITEVSPPTEFQRLGTLLDRYTPQVSIVSPKPDEVLNDTQVAVKFDVKNLPIFKNADFGVGPHIHVTLDNQEYKALYDLNQAATFDHLSAGTHTIRAFASRPWHESFKNKGAYAQVTFNVLTKTGENTPESQTPLLTYSRPVGTYGAEPIMLDFYIQNAPLHLLAKEDEAIDDWQIRATVNGQSFTFDRWEPIYLKGFKQGKNWVKLELLEEDGDAISNVFNSTAHIIDFQPNGNDTLARLVRGEIIANIEAIVNPDYVPPAPEVIPTPVEPVISTPSIVPVEQAKELPKAEPIPSSAPAATSTEDSKPVNSKDIAAPTSIIPVVPIPALVPVVPDPKATAKSEPAAIAPLIPKKTEVIKANPLSEPIKNEPIQVKSPSTVEPANSLTPVGSKVPNLDKITPVVAEPIVPSPIKEKSSPVLESVKATPNAIKEKSVPVLEPVKVSPEPKRTKYPPIVIPGRPIAPKPIVSPTITPKELETKQVSPDLSTNKDLPPKVGSPKQSTETLPKADIAKDITPAKAPSAIAPKQLSDYFKNVGFNSRKESPVKLDTNKPVEKIEEKSTQTSKAESIPSETTQVLTDLSATSSAPIKVLTKSTK